MGSRAHLKDRVASSPVGGLACRVGAKVRARLPTPADLNPEQDPVSPESLAGVITNACPHSLVTRDCSKYFTYVNLSDLHNTPMRGLVPHFTDTVTEAQRSTETCSRSHSFSQV